ncbi:MAG TPA: YbaB/EbfC family nucleoid-associated protein [Saprospiraceae bacterium]|nr:YbaB/EbfC family nucleoid-associated protein [Saprospiraceae bacterium]
MFGDMMGNMEEKQAQMKKQLANITVAAEAGEGAVKVTANANREITNISIDKTKLDWDDQEQVEDLVMVAVNRVLELAAREEALATQKMINDMLPPGMGDLSNLLG